MNRYFVYLVFLNMLSNIVALVPVILLRDRFDGAVLSILLSVLVGTALIMVIVRLLRSFPSEGLPEIIGSFPAFLRVPFLALQALVWFAVGLVVLLYISEVTKRFLSPDFTPVEANVLFLIVLALFANLPSKKLLNMLEVVVWVSVPFIAFIFAKAVKSENMMWDSMQETATHILDLPTYSSFAAAMFMFMGVMTMTIFHRVISPSVKRSYYLLGFGILGIINLFTSFLIPIGFHGADGITDWTYPWFASADSLRLEFGFVERLLFIFLLLYVLISIIAILVYWHIGLEHAKSTLPKGASEKMRTLFPYFLLAGLSAGTIALDQRLGIIELRRIAEWTLIAFLPNALLVAGMLAFVKHKRERQA
ncbi:hypothetical protein MO973_04600 [Paenibacillus sp. TRM 82003]|nr:hypothetical protein [Paenibacillus sp. TRM 82003]